MSPSHSRRFPSPSIDWVSPASFNQRHFPVIGRNHHACGVGVDSNREIIGLVEGVEVVGLPQFFLRHFDELGLGVVVGLQVLQAVW